MERCTLFSNETYLNYNMSTSLVVFAKNPISGKVKTRLIPGISSDGAAELYKAFILDTINKINRLKCRKASIAYTPHGAERAFRKLAGRSIILLPQKGRNLGERMKNAFIHSFAEGAKRVVIIGTDSPTLPISLIQKAFDVLKKTPIVIGPTFDGGYYLIGLSRPNYKIFNGIKWSTSMVFDQTLSKIKASEKQLCVLPPWYDVDTSDNLNFLKTHILAMKMSGLEDMPDNTARFLNI